MRIVCRVRSRYGRKSKTAQMKARNLCSVVSYLSWASVNDHEQYLICLVLLLGCACNSTHSTLTSNASEFRVMRPMEFGSDRTGGAMSSPLSEFMDFNSSPLRGPHVFGWSFHSFVFAAIRVKFGTNRWKMFHSP